MNLGQMFNTGAIAAMIATAKQAGKVYGYDSSEYSEAYYRIGGQEEKMTPSQKSEYQMMRKPQ